MPPRIRSLVALVGAASLAGAVSAHAAHASPGASDIDTLSNKGSAVSVGNTAPFSINVNTNLVGSFTVTCATVLAHFKVPTASFVAVIWTALAPIRVSGCTDSLGGTDTITFTRTRLGFKDAANDASQLEPNSGDHLLLSIPAGGMSLTSSVFPGCTLTVTSPSKLALAYNDRGTAALPSGQSPGGVSASSGCPAGMTVNETLNSDTLALSIPIYDID